MFKTDIADSSTGLFADHPQWGFAQARRFSLAGIEACWLEESDKQTLKETFEEQLAFPEA